MSEPTPDNAGTSNSKTYTGGCHCRVITYTIRLPPSPEASKCNCTICHKTGRLGVNSSKSDIELLTPTSYDDIPTYKFSRGTQQHKFCSTCGIHVFIIGSYEYEGKTVDNFGVNLMTVDVGQGLDLRVLKVGYWDGLRENWEAGMAEKPHEGGYF